MQKKETLIVQQIPRLRRYARALTGDAARADDLVQDCVERAWRKYHLFRRGSDIRAWMFTIMHNLHVNTVRKAINRPAVVSLADWDGDRSIRPAQESAVEARGVVRALALLPPEQREVLLLVGLEELTYREIAKIVGIPIGTVMSRLSRGRQRLREITGDTPTVEAGSPKRSLSNPNPRTP